MSVSAGVCAFSYKHGINGSCVEGNECVRRVERSDRKRQVEKWFGRVLLVALQEN